ncbi:MAG TPA: hypothetical protein VGU20_29460 [Stellaceae bacterium]|nr:hypothetical protein [Stellaceae bacterium]
MNAPLAEMRRLYDRGPSARGLVIDADGVMLGPDCILVACTNGSYRRIDAAALDQVLKTTFGEAHPLRRFSLVLDRIADALAMGDVVKAQLLGLEIPLKALDNRQLMRLQTASSLVKTGFDPNQARDERGRWTAEGGEQGNDTSPSSDDSRGTTDSIEQLWLASFRGVADRGDSNSSASVQEAQYQGRYHDFLRDQLAQITRAAGGQAITEVPITGINGVTAEADLLVKPRGSPFPFLIEVKTGESPQYTDPQRSIYPLAMVGGHVTSFDSRVAAFGLGPGAPFPPLMVLQVYTKGPGSRMLYDWLQPQIEKLLIAIFTRHGVRL